MKADFFEQKTAPILRSEPYELSQLVTITRLGARVRPGFTEDDEGTQAGATGIVVIVRAAHC